MGINVLRAHSNVLETILPPLDEKPNEAMLLSRAHPLPILPQPQGTNC